MPSSRLSKSDKKTLLAFETERSHEGSKIAYDLCKSTAQACLLMNGGAATAVIAFLAKDKVDATLYKAIPYALGGYGIGVAASALMLFSVMMNADYWNYYWYNLAYADDEDSAANSEKVADRWLNAIFIFFGAATLAFVIASMVLACAFAQTMAAVPAK